MPICRTALVALALLGLAACSSSSGGGSPRPADTNVLVIPPGQAVVCYDGSRPPCR